MKGGIFLMQFILADSKLIRESSNVLSEEYPTFSLRV